MSKDSALAKHLLAAQAPAASTPAAAELDVEKLLEAAARDAAGDQAQPEAAAAPKGGGRGKGSP